MNWKGFGRKRSCLNLRYYPSMSGGTDENYESPQSEYPVSGPILEPGTSRTRSRLVNHSTTTFGIALEYKNIKEDKL
jgi:hypothetical protein